jgi:hypothetical protein
MANDQKENKRPLYYLLIGIILICVILVLVEIYTNVASEMGLSLVNSYVS